MQQTKSNEIVKINPADFGLEESKAKQISELFKPMLDKMEDLEKEANKVFKLPISEPDSAIQAKELRLKYVKVRTGTAAIHKELKAFYLNGGRFVDGWKNAQLMASQGVEERLMNIEKYQENIEIERKAKLKSERELQLQPFGTDTQFMQLGELSGEIWLNYFSGVKLQFENAKELERKAELERIEREKKEAEEREKFRIENERLKKEASEREEKQAAIEKERLQKETAERKEREDKERKERQEYESKLKAEREAKEKIESELRAKKQAEEKAEQERLSAIESDLAKGDKEKFADFINDLKILTEKYSFKSKKYKTSYAVGIELINKTINHLSK